MAKKAASMFNPFGLPGLEAIPNVAPLADKLADSVDFVKNLWGGAASAVPGFLVPTLSVEDLDKKITDLRAVETWLETNAALLRATVQSLEVQRNTLLMLKSMGQMSSASAAAAAASAPSAPPERAADSGASPASTAAAEPPQPTPAMVNAAAWWNLVQDQFGKVAGAALAQTVPGRGLGGTAAEKKSTNAKTAKKTAAAKTRSGKKVTAKRNSVKNTPNP
jgi:hypothetical protein